MAELLNLAQDGLGFHIPASLQEAIMEAIVQCDGDLAGIIGYGVHQLQTLALAAVDVTVEFPSPSAALDSILSAVNAALSVSPVSSGDAMANNEQYDIEGVLLSQANAVEVMNALDNAYERCHRILTTSGHQNVATQYMALVADPSSGTCYFAESSAVAAQVSNGVWRVSATLGQLCFPVSNPGAPSWSNPAGRTCHTMEVVHGWCSSALLGVAAQVGCPVAMLLVDAYPASHEFNYLDAFQIPGPGRAGWGATPPGFRACANVWDAFYPDFFVENPNAHFVIMSTAVQWGSANTQVEAAHAPMRRAAALDADVWNFDVEGGGHIVLLRHPSATTSAMTRICSSMALCECVSGEEVLTTSDTAMIASVVDAWLAVNAREGAVMEMAVQARQFPAAFDARCSSAGLTSTVAQLVRQPLSPSTGPSS
jgi:hypothetical protein